MKSKYFTIHSTEDGRLVSLIPTKYSGYLSTITLLVRYNESVVIATQHTHNPGSGQHYEQEVIYVNGPYQDKMSYIIIDEPEPDRPRIIFSNTLDF
jgi:hypothetical protein